MQRPLPRRRVARPRGEERESAVEARQELVRLEERHARGRELDRERQAVEPSTDLADGRRRAEAGLGCPRALDEEVLGVSGGQRVHRIALLGLDVERLAARDEHLRVRRSREQRRDGGRGFDDLLEVVEEEEEVLVRDVLPHAVVGADRRPDRTLDECRVAECLQRNPEDAVGNSSTASAAS